MIFLDTHVLVWLYAGQIERFGPKVSSRLETTRVLASPMATLELQYLHEIGRITEPATAVLEGLSRILDFSVSDTPFADVTAAAWSLNWTRDPFDRLITAEALYHQAHLITADRTICANYANTMWD